MCQVALGGYPNSPLSQVSLGYCPSRRRVRVYYEGHDARCHELLPAGDIPYLKVNNLSFGGPLDFTKSRTFVRKHLHDHDLSRSKVVPGDVLMNIVGPPLGKVAVVPDSHPEYNINQAIARFRAKPG